MVTLLYQTPQNTSTQPKNGNQLQCTPCLLLCTFSVVLSNTTPLLPVFRCLQNYHQLFFLGGTIKMTMLRVSTIHHSGFRPSLDSTSSCSWKNLIKPEFLKNVSLESFLEFIMHNRIKNSFVKAPWDAYQPVCLSVYLGVYPARHTHTSTYKIYTWMYIG